MRSVPACQYMVERQFFTPRPSPRPFFQVPYVLEVARSGPFDASGKGSHPDHPVMIEPTRNLLLGMLEKGGRQNPMDPGQIDLFHFSGFSTRIRPAVPSRGSPAENELETATSRAQGDRRQDVEQPIPRTRVSCPF
jgi:hypothetical protein